MGKRWLVPVGLAAAAMIAAGCGSSSSTGGSGGTGTASSGNTVKSAKIGGATVLTNSKGFTLYWFVPDTSTTSKCYGKCATFWPPVKGAVQAGSGATGKFGTITRTDGSTQATWNGHPLYTFKGDSAPGKATGNNLNVNGGVWKEVVLTGTASTSSSSGGGSGGYGYYAPGGAARVQRGQRLTVPSGSRPAAQARHAVVR